MKRPRAGFKTYNYVDAWGGFFSFVWKARGRWHSMRLHYGVSEAVSLLVAVALIILWTR